MSNGLHILFDFGGERLKPAVDFTSQKNFLQDIIVERQWSNLVSNNIP